MELRKNPDLDLERRRGMFLSIGLLISLSLVLTAFQWEFKIEKGVVSQYEIEDNAVYEIEVLATKHAVPKRPEPVVKKQPPVFVQKPDEQVLKKITEAMPPEDLLIDEPDYGELSIETAPEVVDFAEVMPEPDGGMVNFYKFLGRNMKYPDHDRRSRIEGKVFIQFIVDKDGSITELKVIKGISEGCDNEALRVLAMTPKWKPGKQGINPVKVRMVIPITFVLN